MQRQSVVSSKAMTPQKLVLAVSAMAILAVTLFPPWLYVYTPPMGSEGRSKAQRSAGYHLITSPPLINYEQVAPLFGDLVRQVPVFQPTRRDPVTREVLPKEEEKLQWSASLSSFSVRVDMDVLLVEVVAILILTVLLYLLLRTWRRRGLNTEADRG